MPNFPNLKNDIIFLRDLDNPSEVNICFNPNANKLDLAKKNHCLYAFRWVVHVLTCGRFRLNPHLDQLTQNFLKEMSQEIDQKKFAIDELESVEKAVQNLDVIIKRNGGKETQEIGNLLKVIVKIKNLSPVKNLDQSALAKQEERPPQENAKNPHQEQKKEEPEDKIKQEILAKPDDNINPPVQIPEIPAFPLPQVELQKKNEVIEIIPDDNIKPAMLMPEIPPPVLLKEERLQNVLQDLNDQQVGTIQIAEELKKLLPNFASFTALSDLLTSLLCSSLQHIDKEWILHHAKQLSPSIIKFIVEKSFFNDAGDFVPHLFDALVQEPVDKEKLTALFQAFPAFDNKLIPRGTYQERLNGMLSVNAWRRTYQCFKGVSYKILKNLSPRVCTIIEKCLSDEDRKNFFL